MTRRGHLEIPVIGVAKPDWTVDQLRARARDSIAAHGRVDADALGRLAARLSYVAGDHQEPDTFGRLRQALGSATRPLFCLAIPPSVFGTVASGLAQSGYAAQARVIAEKPFGRDLASAMALNTILHDWFARRDLRRGTPRDRERSLGWGPLLDPHWQMPSRHRHGSARHLQAAARELFDSMAAGHPNDPIARRQSTYSVVLPSKCSWSASAS